LGRSRSGGIRWISVTHGGEGRMGEVMLRSRDKLSSIKAQASNAGLQMRCHEVQLWILRSVCAKSEFGNSSECVCVDKSRTE